MPAFFTRLLSLVTLRRVLAVQIAVSVFSLAAAYTAQYGFHLQPCILCLMQRVPYAAIIVAALTGLFLPPRAQRAVIALCGLAFFAGAGIGFFQVGVEHHWWASIDACGTPFTGGASMEALREQILRASLTPCDVPAFTLFGISMAGFNFLASGAYAIASVVAAARAPK